MRRNASPETAGEDRGNPTRAQAEALWQLLDNIDTLDDACKDDHDAYRRNVRRLVKERFKIAESDGHNLTWVNEEPEDYAKPGYSFPVPR